MSKVLKVPGSQLDLKTMTVPLLQAKSKFHKILEDQAVEVGQSRGPGKDILLPDEDELFPEDKKTLVELRLDDGSVILTDLEGLRFVIQNGGASRGRDASAETVPTNFTFGAQDRSVGVVLKVLRWFKVDPVDSLAKLTTRAAIQFIEKGVKKNSGPGLYRLDEGGNFSARIEKKLEPTGKPFLILLHGTASNTEGSFSGLMESSSDWEKLWTEYKDRIYALEHLTLSESPLDNALALARLLPAGAELHLISHSRGGLIGELLCCEPFSSGEIDAYLQARPFSSEWVQEERKTLEALAQELAKKTFRVERFVRVACPAAGTLMLSDRLDLYLSLVLRAVGYAASAQPALKAVEELLSPVLVEVARRRADARELPGIEAQRPGSPLVRLLNRPGKSLDHDLSVIAGDLAAGNLFQSLRALLGYSFFMEKNDLVVDTRAMYRGGVRKMAWGTLHENSRVTHFSYFREDASRQHLVKALLRKNRNEAAPGFKELKEVAEAQPRSIWRDAPAEKVGTLLYLPDFLGSRLEAEQGRPIWLSAEAIASGELGRLHRKAEGIELGGLVHETAIEALEDASQGALEVVAVPYDWRLGITGARVALVEKLKTIASSEGQPIHLVGHGLGALGILAWAAENVDTWATLRSHGGRAVLVAPPLSGAVAALELATGKSRLLRQLQLLDGSRSLEELSCLFMTFPGLVDLLPDEALDIGWWDEFGGDPPPIALLEEAVERRQMIRRATVQPDLYYVFGAAETTPVAELNEQGDLRWSTEEDGDGWMHNPVESAPKASTFYVASLHQRLLLEPESARLVADLICHGSQDDASRSAPTPRAEIQRLPVLFPRQRDLLNELTAAYLAPEQRQHKTLKIRVAHGSLDRQKEGPVVVGHYAGDGIYGAERFLNRCLGDRLSRRKELNLYPGEAGTFLYVAAQDCSPSGALVVGLGEVGELSGEILTRGIRDGALQMAVDELEKAADSNREPSNLCLSPLLIGTRGGRNLSLRQSMAAIVRGVLLANRALDARFNEDSSSVDGKKVPRLRFERITFVELWSDIAIAAAKELSRLEDDANLRREPGERIEVERRLIPLEGRRGNNRNFIGSWSWWRRLILTEEDMLIPEGPDPVQAGVESGKERKRAVLRGLKFVSLTESARAEERLVLNHAGLVDCLLKQAPESVSGVDDGSVAHALYNLLVPPSLHESLFDGDDLVLVVDRAAGRYPWELLALRRNGKVEPLVSRVKLIRQFRTRNFREKLIPARTNQALVIGDPKEARPRLPGARKECVEVAGLLTGSKHGFQVCRSEAEDSNSIVQKFFLHDYRIMHIAAHGWYEPNRPEVSGVNIGKKAVLSAVVFKKLRAVPEVVFLNCCHLGRLDQPPEEEGLVTRQFEAGHLASSVAEALLELGVKCVVVAGWAVNDNAALIFAREFYQRLLGGEPFGEAVHQARMKVWNGFRQTTTWGAYQAYGSPDFRLWSPIGKEDKETAPFVSEDEALGELEEAVARSANLGRSEDRTQKQKESLAAMEAAFEGSWEYSGRLLALRAEAWANLGEREKAIDLYRRALGAWDGEAPLKAAEQLANLLSRHQSQLEKDATSSAASEDREVALKPVDGAKRHPPDKLWLDWVEQTGSTPGRRALRGGLLKRRAQKRLRRLEVLKNKQETELGDSKKELEARQAREARIAKESPKAKELLCSAAAAYQKGFQERQAVDGKADDYTGVNAMALRWAFGDFDEAKRLKDLLEPISGDCSVEAGGIRTFWHDATDVEIELVARLVDSGNQDGALKEDDVSRFVETFKKRLEIRGDRNQHSSLLEQLEFLRVAAVHLDLKHTGEQLEKIANALLHKKKEE